MTRARTADTAPPTTSRGPSNRADRVAARVRRLKEEIRLYAHYRVAKALAKHDADPAGAYTAQLNAAATWSEIERLLKLIRTTSAGLGGGRRGAKR